MCNELESTATRLESELGPITLERLGPSSWRAWSRTKHLHDGVASHGALMAYGDTPMSALKRLEQRASNETVRNGEWCSRSCKDYRDPCY